MQVVIELKELEEMEEKISSIIVDKVARRQEWYNLKEACLAKGINYNTANCNPRYQPLGGREGARVCGRKVWSKEDIDRWLTVTDDDLQEYLTQCQSPFRAG